MVVRVFRLCLVNSHVYTIVGRTGVIAEVHVAVLPVDVVLELDLEASRVYDVGEAELDDTKLEEMSAKR